MFALKESELGLRMLGCGDGPAGFNSVFTQMGGYAISLDPIYKFTVAQLRERIAETYQAVIQQVQKNQIDFVWEGITSIDELGRIRMNAMEIFLSDFESGKKEGRYVVGELPNLPFKNKQFDIALSSHL